MWLVIFHPSCSQILIQIQFLYIFMPILAFKKQYTEIKLVCYSNSFNANYRTLSGISRKYLSRLWYLVQREKYKLFLMTRFTCKKPMMSIYATSIVILYRMICAIGASDLKLVCNTSRLVHEKIAPFNYLKSINPNLNRSYFLTVVFLLECEWKIR